jgi:tRNA(fMet)-specific endonuclease VapC
LKYLFDSNVVIAASLGIGDGLRARMSACDEGAIVTSSVAYAEVVYGSMQGKPPPLDKLKAFVEEVAVLAFDAAAAEAYASLPFRKSSFDQLIAAHALSKNLVLVTDNVRHFRHVPGLQVENWTST